MACMKNWNVLPGNGPWRILPECPCGEHNTQRAACTGDRQRRCICPRGQEMKRRRYNGRTLTTGQLAERALLDAFATNYPTPIPNLKTTVRGRGRPVGAINQPTYQKTHTGARPSADLRFGSCRSEEGIKIMDAMLDASRGAGAASARRQMRNLCMACPVIEQCDKWIKEAEEPAGSWPGMYAGLSAEERRRAAKFKEESRVA